jgi:N-acetylneuraminic acid mutarotase
MSFIYNAMHYAGPKLTVANVQKGLFSVPAAGGASSGTVSFQSGYGRTVGLPYDEYLGLGTDLAMIWWNADLQTDGTNAVANFPGKGRFMYLNDGKRFSFGGFPKSEPQFFDESASIYEYPPGQAYATGQVPATMPCTGCPSQGGTGA